MNKQQAFSLLSLIADLYSIVNDPDQVIQTPDPEPERVVEPVRNGREPVPVKT